MRKSGGPSRRQVLIAGGLASGAFATGSWGLRAAHGMESGHRAGIAFGTNVTLKAMHHDAARLETALDAAWAQIQRVEEAASLFRAESALSRLNRDGALNDAPQALVEMLLAAQEVSALTNGAFDVTVQPLWKLYEASYAAGHAPAAEELDAVRDRIGYRNIAIDGRRVRLLKPGMALTLNGIAQGYATEQCLRALADHGIADAFLNTGEIGIAGKRDGKDPWTAGIADPRHEGAYVALARPLSGVLATSGDYATAFSNDFSVHHIFDPKTLRSPPKMASVSVLAESGALADALATAMMIMEPNESLALAEKLSGVEALLVTKQGETMRTAAFPAV